MPENRNNDNVAECTNNGNGRCATHENGRHKIDTNGLCKVGRRLRKELCECPVCKTQFPARTGMVLASQRKEATPFSVLNELITQVGNGTVCPKCAEESNEDFERAIFITPEALRESNEDFVEKFIHGNSVIHRHEFLGGQMRNWCDFCGRLVPMEDEENMGGIRRNGESRSVICLCPHCRDLAHSAMPDLPSVSFFEALEQVTGAPVRRPRPATAPKAERKQKPMREPKARKGQGEDVADIVPTAPAPRAPFVSGQKSLASVKDIYEALMSGDRRVRFGGTDKDTVLTKCTVHATQSRLCKTPNGAGWEQMKSVVRDGMAFPFCPECAAQLTIAGVRLEMTHKQAMQMIGAAGNGGSGGSVARDRMEFVNPTDRPGKKVSNARKRELAQNAAERAELQKKLATKLATMDGQIKAEQAKIKPVQVLATAASLQLSSAQDNLRGKQDELNAARESGADSDTLELMELEVADIQARIVKQEADAVAADELLTETQTEVSSAVAKMQCIRDQVERAGPLGLREPHIHQVRSSRGERTGKPESKKDKGKNKDKKRNGGSKAA